MEGQKPRILLVDDDELSRRMMGVLLSEKGYNYDTASNGIEAVESVQSQSYDMVLMDLQMPLMDGFDAARKIRDWEAGEKHTPIVALTAMLFDNEIQRCLSAGMDDCIAKPFDTDTLFQLIETHVSRSGTQGATAYVESSETPVNQEVLDIQEALPRFSNNIEVYKNFLKEFLDELPDKIGHLRRAFKSSDFKTLADAAHNLKGISASMGAKQLSYLSQKLDQNSQDGDSLLIQGSLEEIEKHLPVLQEEAKKILPGWRGNQET